MTLRHFRLPFIVLLVVGADMLRDIPHELGKLAGAILIVVALLIMQRTAYKRGRKDALTEIGAVKEPQPARWYKDLGATPPESGR